MEPFRQWCCNTCGEWINSPTEAMLFWLVDTKKSPQTYRGFYIVHQYTASPLQDSEDHCNPSGYESSNPDFRALATQVSSVPLAHHNTRYEPADFIALFTSWIQSNHIHIPDMD